MDKTFKAFMCATIPSLILWVAGYTLLSFFVWVTVFYAARLSDRSGLQEEG
jgi:hypothetical protein